VTQQATCTITQTVVGRPPAALGLDRAGTCLTAAAAAAHRSRADGDLESPGSGDGRRFQFGGLRFIAI